MIVKVNNTVRTASVNSARKTSNSKTTSTAKSSSKAVSSKKTTSTAKSSSKATSSKTTSTAKSSSKATSSKKTTSTAKSSSKATSNKTTSTAKSSSKATSSKKTTSTAKSSSKTKTGIQASSNKGLVDAKTKTNTKTSIASTIASKITSSAKSIINSSSKGNSNLTSSNSSSIIGSVTKYIVDAPAIYTSQALKSTIGKDTSSLGNQLSKGYVPGMPSDVFQKQKQSSKDYISGMPSDVYNKVKNSTKPKYNGKNSSINKMLSNLDKDKTLKLTSDQKKAMLYAGEKMLNDGYDAKFVAGVLANIKHEGEPGKFESSNYSTHPEEKPKYLENMDKDFGYAEKYSGKNISEVGIKETVKLQKEASKKVHIENVNGKKTEVIDQFGLGMFQFTGARTSALLDEYQAFYNRTKENHPTKEQCLEIEISFALKELKSENYRTIYESWKEGKKTAYSAGEKFCKEYENPKDKDSQAIIRGNDAEKIYAVMKKK